ncbi:MAG: hypothetical protein IPH69_03625 [Bacteroidales bacterium]|nr:hypothetical protein [Bacteroidales bacterium]
MKKLIFILVLVLLFGNAFSQQGVTESDTVRKHALNVYFPDVPDFIKKEITFINYVRDLKEADVCLIISFEETGSGGETITVYYVGQNKFSDMKDTVKITTSPDDTEDVLRKKAVSLLKMAFMRFMLKTPLSEFFDTNFTQPVREIVETDKWNSWVFRANLNGSLNGEKRYESIRLSESLSANRITEKSKFQSYVSASWQKQKYEMADSSFQYDYTRSYGLNVYYAKSLTDHWSAGISSGLSASSYGYLDLQYRITPAIEYDIYPYSESTRRQLRIMYEIGYLYNNYSDTTIYNKLTEQLGLHRLSASWEVIQKWGSVDFTIRWNNYFHDWSKNNLNADLYMSVRIFKGLNINFSGSASVVNDQLSLPKAGVSDFDILTRRRMTETKFEYYGYFGFSYTFGSIYNNAVNPRFGW